MSADTPSVCGSPAEGGPCVLPVGHNRGQLDIPQNHDAAPGSSSPDTAALVAELRDEADLPEPLDACPECGRWRRPYLGAQILELVERIAELEAENRRLATTMTGDTAVDLRVLYAYELGIADHPQTPTEESP